MNALGFVDEVGPEHPGQCLVASTPGCVGQWPLASDVAARRDREELHARCDPMRLDREVAVRRLDPVRRSQKMYRIGKP